jgi:hypothetical protein
MHELAYRVGAFVLGLLGLAVLAVVATIISVGVDSLFRLWYDLRHPFRTCSDCGTREVGMTRDADERWRCTSCLFACTSTWYAAWQACPESQRGAFLAIVQAHEAGRQSKALRGGGLIQEKTSSPDAAFIRWAKAQRR